MYSYLLHVLIYWDSNTVFIIVVQSATFTESS